MDCPVCTTAMSTAQLEGIDVDFCRDGCLGLWFDLRELAKVQGMNNELCSAIQGALESTRPAKPDRGPLSCPHCGIKLHMHNYPGTRGVVVDECYGCGGIFLDAGELKMIRETRMSAAEKAAFAQGLVDTVPQYHDSRLDLARKQARTDGLKTLARHLIPFGKGVW